MPRLAAAIFSRWGASKESMGVARGLKNVGEELMVIVIVLVVVLDRSFEAHAR
jgi:hypothetical protein